MIPLDEARERLAALARPIARRDEEVPLANAAGRVAAQALVARRTQPAGDLSAMDGYALRAADAGKPLTIVGQSAAGRPLASVIAAGQAARIFTGAMLPTGTDCVLVQENASVSGAALRQIEGQSPVPGRHVRAEGSDFRAGDVLVAGGSRLSAAQIALAIAGGHGTVTVHPRPRVAILSTGDELVPPGAPTTGDRLPASNAAMIAALLPGIRDIGIVGDDLDALVGAIRTGAADADVLVTSGGASVGDHDLVRAALERAGATIDFWRVAMRPGKPLLAGRLGDTVILGLPGNPVSAYVTALLFVLPLVRMLEGDANPFARSVSMPLAAPLPANDGRTDHLRAVHVAGGLRPVGPNDSAALAGLAAADALIVRAPYAPAAAVGDPVEAILLA